MKKFATSLFAAVVLLAGFNATAWAVVDAGGVNLLGGGAGGGADPNNGSAGAPNNGGYVPQPSPPTDPTGGAGGEPQTEVVTLTRNQANMARITGGYVTGSSAIPSSDNSGVWVDSVTFRDLTGRTFAAGNTDKFGNPTSGGDLEGIELGAEHTAQLSQQVFVPNDERARAAAQFACTNELAKLTIDLTAEVEARDWCQRAYYANPQDPNAQAQAMQGYQRAVGVIAGLQGLIAEKQLELAAFQR